MILEHPNALTRQRLEQQPQHRAAGERSLDHPRGTKEVVLKRRHRVFCNGALRVVRKMMLEVQWNTLLSHF